MAGTLMPSDRQALTDVTDTQVNAALAADWKTFVDTFTRDVVRMPPDLLPIVGWEAVFAWVRTFPRIIEAKNWIDDINGDGNVAFMRGHNLLLLEIDGKPTRVSFKWFAAYRKERDDVWRMAADMWNANPPPTE